MNSHLFKSVTSLAVIWVAASAVTGHPSLDLIWILNAVSFVNSDAKGAFKNT